MKQIKVPYIAEAETLSFDDLDKVMETEGAKDFISEVN